MLQAVITQVLSAIGIVLSFLVYENIIKKDSNKDVTDMAVLMTKVDMLLSNSTEAKEEIKNHEKLISEHNVKIKNIEDTLRFRRVNVNEQN